MPSVVSILRDRDVAVYEVTIAAANSLFARSQARAWLRKEYPTIVGILRVEGVERLDGVEESRTGQLSVKDYMPGATMVLNDYKVTLRVKERWPPKGQ